jgi:hypothetical protein
MRPLISQIVHAQHCSLMTQKVVVVYPPCAIVVSCTRQRMQRPLHHTHGHHRRLTSAHPPIHKAGRRGRRLPFAAACPRPEPRLLPATKPPCVWCGRQRSAGGHHARPAKPPEDKCSRAAVLHLVDAELLAGNWSREDGRRVCLVHC